MTTNEVMRSGWPGFRSGALRPSLLLLLLAAPFAAAQEPETEIETEPVVLEKGVILPRHPRLPGPSKDWLERMRANPVVRQNWAKAAEKLPPADKIRGLQGIRETVVAWMLTRRNRFRERAEELARNPLRNMGIQTKLYILSMIYDWMHADLGEKVRRELANRIAELCGQWKHLYLKGWVISPYNVVGYRRLGAGIWWGAAAIAREHPDADEYVKFAEEVLFERYLPVWRQIMDGGGWHEGAEYVDLGIAQTVHLALSAWGTATRRDLFHENPWIEDFLLYPIYGARPDKTPIRIADVAWGLTPRYKELLPLAVVYKNPFALQHFTGGRYRPDEPTGFPWGEPMEKGMTMAPASELPLHHHFKGWGVVVMRSDWSEDATFATLRIGDHFWSHMHFDSGSFTIYKRGALAIDSGNYGVGYGSSHHVMYAMQSAAHNLVTVTDPGDFYPDQGHFVYTAAGKKAKLPFPNDGGHRRVGSLYTGAPLTRADWEARRDEFEMGDILRIDAQQDYVYVLGDVTAAYGNAASQGKDYRTRTRRLDRCLRTFVYLRPDHFLVMDDVKARDAAFKKRWLLHTINEPVIEGNLVTATRAEAVRHRYSWPHGLAHRTADRRHYRYGGRLFLKMLLPEESSIEKIGGPGREFEVAGRNYAGARANPQWMKPDPTQGPAEPGSWRIEVSPKTPRKSDRFLAVLQAASSETASMTPIGRLDSEGGAEVIALLGEDKELRITALTSLDNPGRSKVAFHVPGGLTVRILIVGLEPRESYRLGMFSLDGEKLPEPEILVSSAHGTLYLKDRFAGRRRVEIVPVK